MISFLAAVAGLSPQKQWRAFEKRPRACPPGAQTFRHSRNSLQGLEADIRAQCSTGFKPTDLRTVASPLLVSDSAKLGDHLPPRQKHHEALQNW